jgi:hypothetical protein
VSLYLVFDFLNPRLVGCPFEHEEHQKTGEKGDKDHSYPWAHAAERKEEDIEYFAEAGIEYPHDRIPY